MTLLLPDGSPYIPPVPRDGMAQVTAKAAFGTGVGFYGAGHRPLMSQESTPQAIMRRAQMAYHMNPWVGTAEAVVTRKVVNLPWHLEDGEDEEYDEKAPPEVMAAKLLIERPQYLLPNARSYSATNSKRLMWSLTSRHIGLCGMAHWYGERVNTQGIPVAWLYVNPARMWSESDTLGNLTGWMLDASGVGGDGQPYGGVQFKLNEILTFYLDSPDHGHYGTGIYERAFLKAQISGMADQHAGYVIGTGGRIAGIMSPKEGSIPTEAFNTIKNELRQVNESPDAAKRTTIMQGPMDFTPTAANPSELDLVELSKMNREDIFTIWGVPASQAPTQTTVGLNGGAVKGFDEAVLMQGAVHDRVIAIQETIQLGWLDLYKPLVIELEVEEPTFDDDTPAYDLLVKSNSTALTNAERRDLIGLPPTGDDAIDNAILLPVNQALWATAPGERSKAPVGIEDKINPPPAPVINVPPPPPVDAAAAKASIGQVASGMHRSLTRLRDNLERTAVPEVRSSVDKVLEEQQKEIITRITANIEHIVSHPNDDATWWNADKWDKKLRAALQPNLVRVAEATSSHIDDILT